jgi:hypothetical protein
LRYDPVSYTVPLKALTNDVFEYGRRDRWVVVLKAFFDDSGTHLNSDVVVMGGLIAPEDGWAALEVEWAEALADLGLRKMHMASCEGRRGQFKNMERGERDRVVARFRGIIERLKGRMLFSAVSRAVWQKVASTTILGRAFPDPIDYCFNSCMRHAMESRRTTAPIREPVVVTFDSREQSISQWAPLAKGYEKRWPDRVAGFSFGSMEKVLPLQAADIIAYEVFVFQCELERLGKEPSPRQNFAKLSKALPGHGGFSSEQNLRGYLSKLEAGVSQPPS